MSADDAEGVVYRFEPSIDLAESLDLVGKMHGAGKPTSIVGALESVGYTRVLHAQRVDVYCNGTDRLWVRGSRPSEPEPAQTQRCPSCRCGAFGAGR